MAETTMTIPQWLRTTGMGLDKRHVSQICKELRNITDWDINTIKGELIFRDKKDALKAIREGMVVMGIVQGKRPDIDTGYRVRTGAGSVVVKTGTTKADTIRLRRQLVRDPRGVVWTGYRIRGEEGMTINDFTTITDTVFAFSPVRAQRKWLPPVSQKSLAQRLLDYKAKKRKGEIDYATRTLEFMVIRLTERGEYSVAAQALKVLTEKRFFDDNLLRWLGQANTMIAFIQNQSREGLT